jgi:hypothetical protein
VLKNLWLVKPDNENRGRGIEIMSTWKEFVDLATAKGKDKGNQTVVMQKYIEKPLLFYGRKFDIRVLALVDDQGNFFLYKPCYLRTSSEEYSLSNKDKNIHLTNNCFQMRSVNYQKFEDGNQIPYEFFIDYLKQNYLPKYPDLNIDHIMQRMKDIMIDSVLAAHSKLDPRKRPGNKFEIIGFDFLIDEDLRVWLIEVNTGPYMGPVLASHYSNFMVDMLDDTFKLTVDRYFLEDKPILETVKDTEYEILWSNRLKINKRSTMGLLSHSTENQPYSA